MIGRSIGNYVVQQRVGSGGMGTVYLAEHPRIKRKVAIKVLRAELSDDPEAVSRFFTEARSANEIHNEHIIEILDFGEFEGGAPYLIMEWLDGLTLTQYLAQRPRPPWDRTLHILSGIAAALDAAHERGVVHRDLKPDNIILVSRGADRHFVKVLDFGIAKLLDQRSASFKTRTNSIVGTPAYMSPEQCRSATELMGGRSDVYSLGIIAFQMIAGRLPFEAQGAIGMITAHATETPPSLCALVPELPEAIDAAVQRALEKEPQNRWARASELVDAIAHAGFADAETNPMDTPAPSRAPTARVLERRAGSRPPVTTMSGSASQLLAAGATAPRRSRVIFGAAALVLVGAVALATAGIVRRGASSTEAAPPSAPVAAAPPPAAAPAPAPAPSPGATPTANAPAATPSPAAGSANKITIDIRTEPAGAEILLDDAVLPNPFHGAFEKNDVRHRLVVRHPGHRPSASWEVFDTDRTLAITLKPGSAGSSSGPSSGAPRHPGAKPRGGEGDEPRLHTDDTITPSFEK